MDGSENPTAHPALDFGLVGVENWPGVRWVAGIQGALGEPVLSIDLEHDLPDQAVVVRTAPKGRWDEDWPDMPGAQAVAQMAILTLVDLARPVSQDEGWRTRYNERMWDFAAQEATTWERWEQSTWTLAGASLRARIYRFADRWAGLTRDDDARYVAVMSFGDTQTNLRLDQVEENVSGVDFTRPFSAQDVVMNDDVDFSDFQSDRVAADHLRVLQIEPRPSEWTVVDPDASRHRWWIRELPPS